VADVAIKRQTTALVLSTIVARTRKKHRTGRKKTDKPVLCQRTFSSVIRAVFFNTHTHTVELHGLT